MQVETNKATFSAGTMVLAFNIAHQFCRVLLINEFTGTTGRERCDSLPSRARTTSEGHPTPLVLGHSRAVHLGSHAPRPHSMYGRGMSYSPPVSSMPISPASGACSTDSAGSSLSMDDGVIENIMEEGLTPARYGHSLTPDEPVILEENGDDYAPWPSNQQKYSPNFKSHSPSQVTYLCDFLLVCLLCINCMCFIWEKRRNPLYGKDLRVYIWGILSYFEVISIFGKGIFLFGEFLNPFENTIKESVSMDLSSK